MRTAITALLGLLATFANADQALVRTYGQAGLEIGQAYLLHHGPQCLAILPTHVVDEAGAHAALLREGRPPLLGEVDLATDLGEDFSVAVVHGALTSECGYAAGSVSRGVSSRVEQGGIATIRTVNGDGTVAQLSVTIIDDDGAQFLRIQPTNDINQLSKGQSGSLLMVGDTPIGMLMSVDARFGFGKVMRFDHALGKLDAHLYATPQAPQKATPLSQVSPKGGTSTADGPGLSVVSWTALAVSPENRISNLVDPGASAPWIAEVESWPVTIELDLAGEEVIVWGMRLGALGVEAGQRPNQMEVLVNSSATSKRWRSVMGGDVSFSDSVAVLNFGAQRARQVKLIFYSTGGTGARLGLRSVSFLSE